MNGKFEMPKINCAFVYVFPLKMFCHMSLCTMHITIIKFSGQTEVDQRRMGGYYFKKGFKANKEMILVSISSASKLNILTTFK